MTTFVISSLSSSELNELRLIPVAESHITLGLKPSLGRDYIHKEIYPIPVRKQNGKNYVRYKHLVEHVKTLFNDDVNDSGDSK